MIWLLKVIRGGRLFLILYLRYRNEQREERRKKRVAGVKKLLEKRK
jgi:hypothetical protein